MQVCRCRIGPKSCTCRLLYSIKQDVILNIIYLGVNLDENIEKVAYKILKRCVCALLCRRLTLWMTTLSELKLKKNVRGNVTAVTFLFILFQTSEVLKSSIQK